LYPFKFGTAGNCARRLDRMNEGWKLSRGRRCARLALCNDWVYPTPPLEAEKLDDREVDEAAERLFVAWPFASILASEMREWQAEHVTDHSAFESNGVGEIRAVSIEGWDRSVVGGSNSALALSLMIESVASGALKALACELEAYRRRPLAQGALAGFS